MKKYDGILFLTDLDGTLLRDDKSISRENLDAIKRFQEQGGAFSFVTGRSPVAMKDLCELLRPNAPVGCLNGCGIYDVERDTVLEPIALSPDALQLVAFVDGQLPEVGIEIFTPSCIWFCKQSAFTEKHRRDEGLLLLTAHYNDITDPIVKVLFATERETIPVLAEALAAHPLAPRFGLMQTDPNYYEILPHGIDKSRAVQRLRSLLPQIHTVISVGDNDNDAPMLRASNVSYAVANASPAAKAAATHLTVSNQDHAIAKILENL